MDERADGGPQEPEERAGGVRLPHREPGDEEPQAWRGNREAGDPEPGEGVPAEE